MPNNLVIPSSSSSSRTTSSSKMIKSRNAASPSLSFASAIGTLTFGKASRVFAAFVSFHYLQDRVALPLYLLFVTFGAALTLLLLQRPWRGKRIGAKRAKKVLLAGGLLVTTLYTWTAGLRSAGPLRTLLVDGAELPLLYLFAVVTRRELPEKRKTRGAVLMLIAYCLLIWDASGHVPDVSELEKSRFGQRAEHMVDRFRHRHPDSERAHTGQEQPHANHHESDQLVAGFGEDDQFNNDRSFRQAAGRRKLLTTFQPNVKGPGGVKDAFIEGTALRCEVGVVLVLLSSVLVQGGRGFSRRLATELGGAKRHFALSMSAAVVWVTPLAILSWVSSSIAGSVLSLQAVGGITRIDITTSHMIGFLGVGFLWLVLPYYSRAVVSTSVSTNVMMHSAVVSPFVMAVFVTEVFGGAKEAGGLSWILFVAFVLECLGVSLMMAGGAGSSKASQMISELPIDQTGATSNAGAGAGKVSGAGGSREVSG